MSSWKSDPARVDALRKLPGLKGPALSIVMALMLSQSPLLAYELQAVTGYGNEAITRGLRNLEVLQIVVRVGHSQGYLLAPEWRQLALPLRPPDDELSTGCGENDPVFADDPQKPDHLLVSSSRSLNKKEDLLTNYQEAAQYPQKPDIDQVEAENTVPGWLAFGGIAPDSLKMRLLAQKIQSPEYAKAHVLEHLHERREWQRDVVAGTRNGRREPGTGTLIYRLEANWPAPAMRCADCLAAEVDCRCNGRITIPAEYADIILR